MLDISVKGLVKAFEEDKNILNGLSFDINSGDRVGILGSNGAGKTTLFRLLTGEISSDEGDVSIAAGKRLGLISQIPVYPPHYTSRDVLNAAHDRFRLMSERMSCLEAEMSRDATNAVLREYDMLSSEFARQGGYDAETMLARVANGLNIPASMLDQGFDSLSGGEKTRVNLARLILEDTDILLLDEPTNHLDIKSIEWLEEYLTRFKGTVLAVSHDRYFLDRVVSRVIEIVRGKAEFYSGNYSFYVTEKQRRHDEQTAKFEKEQSEAKRLRESADRLAAWGTGNKRLMKKAAAVRTRAERTLKTGRPVSEKRLRAKFEEREFFGDEVLVIDDISKSFAGIHLFSKISLEVQGGERIALTGANGAGKTTLLKLIIGSEEPNSGYVRLGPSVRMAYLPQIITFNPPDRSVLDTVIYEKNCSVQTARNMLGAFKFRGDDVFRPVGALSGGEKSRLYLCMLMSEDISLLILDEPTNHLDIQSREWIEEAVEDYEGALIFVSHDRYFINRFADRIWELENSLLTDFRGSFEEYGKYKENAAARKQIIKNDARRRDTSKKQAPSPEKLITKAERDIKVCEDRIARLDEDAARYASDYQKLMDIHAERELAENDLLELYILWDSLTG